MGNNEQAVKLIRAYLDFIHSPDESGAARPLFDAYLKALLDASGKDRINLASNFHHRTWRQEIQYIVGFGRGKEYGARCSVIPGYVRGRTDHPVNSFHNLKGIAERNESGASYFWDQRDNCANLKASVARADFGWWQACDGRPTQAVRIAALVLDAIRANAKGPEFRTYPLWLGLSERPRLATRQAAAKAFQSLRSRPPAPFSVPLAIFLHPAANKVALLAAYLEAQGLRPREIAASLRLHDLQGDSGRPPSRLLYDWRARHPTHFERVPSRYETAEPPTHFTHLRFCSTPSWNPHAGPAPPLAPSLQR